MYYKMGYELMVVLIVGIFHTALLKKVLDTFLPAGDKDRLIWKITAEYLSQREKELSEMAEEDKPCEGNSSGENGSIGHCRNTYG